MGAQVFGPPTLFSSMCPCQNYSLEGLRHLRELDIWASVKSIFVWISWGKVWARARNSFMVVEFSRNKKTFAESSWIHWDITLSLMCHGHVFAPDFGFQLHIWINERSNPGFYLLKDQAIDELENCLGLAEIDVGLPNKGAIRLRAPIDSLRDLIHPKAFQTVDTCITGKAIARWRTSLCTEVCVCVWVRGHCCIISPTCSSGR